MLGLHTEIVAAASDFTCVWELMFKMGRVVFWDYQSLNIGLRVSWRNPKKHECFYCVIAAGTLPQPGLPARVTRGTIANATKAGRCVASGLI